MHTFYHILPKFTRGKLPLALQMQCEIDKNAARSGEIKGKIPYSSTQSSALPCPAEKQDKAEVSCYQKKGAPTL